MYSKFPHASLQQPAVGTREKKHRQNCLLLIIIKSIENGNDEFIIDL